MHLVVVGIWKACSAQHARSCAQTIYIQRPRSVELDFQLMWGAPRGQSNKCLHVHWKLQFAARFVFRCLTIVLKSSIRIRTIERA